LQSLRTQSAASIEGEAEAGIPERVLGRANILAKRILRVFGVAAIIDEPASALPRPNATKELSRSAAANVFHFNRGSLRLLAFQNSQCGQRVVHFSSLIARNSGLTRGTRMDSVLSCFHASLKSLWIELKNRGSV
jgi:hypothetical protein